MSVSSILAFVLAGVAAKAKSVQVARRSERIAELESERDRQYEANAALIMRIAELEGDVHRANIQFRRDQELIDMWRERSAGAPLGALVPALPFRPPHIAQAQMQQAQAAMQQAQYQGLQNQGLAQHNAQQSYANVAPMGLLGVQSLIDTELWCNCVPSRSQVWATSDPE